MADQSPVPNAQLKNDPFNLSRLRISQDFAEKVGVKKALLTVPVRKPNRQEYFRVRPGAEWTLETAVLELKEENETYLVDPSLWAELPGEIKPKGIRFVLNRQGVASLWAINMPGEDGRLDNWSRSAHQAAELATQKWIRLSSNRSLGAYEVYESIGDIPDPEWPEASFQEVIKIAFKDYFITSMDHMVVRKLRGSL